MILGRRLGPALAGLCTGFLALCGAAAAQDFDPQEAPFAIEIGGETIPYQSFFTSVVPEGELTVALDRDAPAGAYSLVMPEGGAAAFEDGKAVWRAPDAPGESREIKVVREEGGEISLRVFILQPAGAMDSEGRINGYKIGAYPEEALRGLDAYSPPAGFVEVTAANMDARVSPHFTLGQFICKQQQDHWPKYVILDTRLILKLEALMADVNEQGIRTDEFFIMSGYRTPWYNRAIGNTTTYSRHVYGGAADVYIDTAPRDGDMDDVNGDGKVTLADAEWMFDRAAALEKDPRYSHLVGGLGKYDRNAAHGPFLHVDSRGYEARW